MSHNQNRVIIKIRPIKWRSMSHSQNPANKMVYPEPDGLKVFWSGVGGGKLMVAVHGGGFSQREGGVVPLK